MEVHKRQLQAQHFVKEAVPRQLIQHLLVRSFPCHGDDVVHLHEEGVETLQALLEAAQTAENHKPPIIRHRPSHGQDNVDHQDAGETHVAAGENLIQQRSPSQGAETTQVPVADEVEASRPKACGAVYEKT